MENVEQFVSINRIKGLLEVDENKGSFFLVVSHFLEDADSRGQIRSGLGVRSFLAQGELY